MSLTVAIELESQIIGRDEQYVGPVGGRSLASKKQQQTDCQEARKQIELFHSEAR